MGHCSHDRVSCRLAAGFSAAVLFDKTGPQKCESRLAAIKKIFDTRGAVISWNSQPETANGQPNIFLTLFRLDFQTFCLFPSLFHQISHGQWALASSAGTCSLCPFCGEQIRMTLVIISPKEVDNLSLKLQKTSLSLEFHHSVRFITSLALVSLNASIVTLVTVHFDTKAALSFRRSEDSLASQQTQKNPLCITTRHKYFLIRKASFEVFSRFNYPMRCAKAVQLDSTPLGIHPGGWNLTKRAPVPTWFVSEDQCTKSHTRKLHKQAEFNFASAIHLMTFRLFFSSPWILLQKILCEFPVCYASRKYLWLWLITT